MVSPCKTVHAKSKPEATKTSKLIEKYVFYLDIKNSAESKLIESKIKKLGGRVEVFLVDSVTHVVSDAAPCAARPLPVPPSTNSPAPHTWGGRRRADAMLERAALLQPPCRPSAAPVPLLPSNVPVWSVPKVKEFLSRLWSAAYKKLHTEERALQEPFIKFEAIDRKSRAVYKELGAWPELQLKGAHSGCPFMSPGEARASKGPAAKARNIPSSATRKRMTRKTKPRPKEQVDVPLKQSGYCEICRVEYDHLADHERSVSHLSFVKNCSNFLSLDSLISANADVEAFLKMNKPVTVANNSLERRSLRNIIKSHQDETQDPRKQLEVICNGAEPHSPHTPCTSPALGHYLRSKGGPEQDYPPKVSPQGLLNGSASPPRLNGKIEAESRKLPQTTNRSIRWRRPSPEGTPPIRDTQTYYRVVGMSTKLRSSNNFTPAPTPTSNRAPPGLVVKFRRVRRSELSVLSDEAENFMFPKKDDSDTEDEVETTPSSRKRPSSALLSESPVKEEVMSGDEEWDAGRRNPRRQAHIESYRDSIEAEPPLEPEPPGTPAPLGAEGPPPAAPEPEVEGETKQRCLKWEEGRLRASEEVERLTYTFEQVPHSEPWYHTFRRQDEGKENTKSIINYLGYYSKSLVLPYEMSEIPPLKPNCCALSQVKRPSDAKSRPPRSYGTRGMKKMRKIKPADPVFTFNSTSLSRKSPREHASTLAILGGLIHRKSKFSCSDDSKSLPSIAEEDCSSDTTPYTPAPLPPCDAEISMQIDALLSSVYEGEEDFEVPVEAEDCGVKLDHTSVKPDVIQLLQDFEECDILDNTVREIHENVQPEAPKRRRGYKFKKKNRTGWPNKKKLKRDPPSTVGSASSSREPSREPSQHRPPQEDSAPKDNGHVELNENSITWSDTEEIETASVSSKYTEASEELPLQMPTCSVPPVQEWDRDRDLQPVVRVLKMEAKLERRLRSADVNRRLRARRRPARPHR